MVGDAMAEEGVSDYWAWFYTPMALPLATQLAPRGVVYDCMDELTLFKHAPRQLVQRENALFKMADLVFTGGRSLYNAKRSRHPDVHCFPSSVDAKHFSRADEHRLLAGIARPRLGYCGVIDERINLERRPTRRARRTWPRSRKRPSPRLCPRRRWQPRRSKHLRLDGG